MIADWSSLNTLTTPAGNLALNAASGNRYLALNNRCDSGADLRVTFDNMPQADGQLNHTQYLTGYKMRLALALWTDTGPACGGDAQEMLDELGAHIDALRNPTGADVTRIVWTPEGMANRMINELNLMEKSVVTTEPGGTEGIVTVTFGVVSPFPYEMSEAEQTPATITGGTGRPATDLVNEGNTQFWPVFRVHGPTHEFWIYNFTTGMALHYDSSLPGASIIGTSEYLEIDMFRGTVVLNGDQDAGYIAGIDFEETDFWALAPGVNEVAVVGAASTVVLWNDAWL